ncbi:MAG: nucleotide pyrophosphohydrolase [Gammaproteobacteria bacterium]
MTIDEIKEQLRKFADERDWEQFHSPKNLAMALSGEVGELCAEFQWLSEDQSKSLSAAQLKSIRHEIGDVLIYLIRLSDKLQIDLLDCAAKKLEINAKKYPVDEVKGSAKKYTEYGPKH